MLTSVIVHFLISGAALMSGNGVGGFAGVLEVGRMLSLFFWWWPFVVGAAPPIHAALSEPHSLESVAPIVGMTVWTTFLPCFFFSLSFLNV
jgi:hypothetical protein